MKKFCKTIQKRLSVEGMSFGITSNGKLEEIIVYGNLWYIGYTDLLDVERAYVHSKLSLICLDLVG